ncbi:MAG: glycoside hydrolase, partial [Bacteroidales bacterium]|nr:glycoside hydrolase [Bacteroidales bacterium]
VTWHDGWPVIGINGKVPDTLDLPISKGLSPGIVSSDDFDRKKGEQALPAVWQWNHNPDNRYWSLTARKGFLRLTTVSLTDDFEKARNTLTQRTIGPRCSGIIKMDVSGMKEGDFAGLALLQKRYGLVGVKFENGQKRIVVILNEDNIPREIESVPLKQNNIYLKAICDFSNMNDSARFSYSLDSIKWVSIGKPLKMKYDLAHFMGYRFGLFNYATKQTGGYIDFDWFRISLDQE